MIRRDGHVIQFVSTKDMAWHAGVSQWRNREKCNEFSLGIELEGTDTHLYTREQYSRLEEIILKCRTAHPDIENDLSEFKGGAFDYLPKPFDVNDIRRVALKAFNATLLISFTSNGFGR